MSHFGFIPSDELLYKIQTAVRQKNAQEPLYLMRDEIALMVNQEIIDAILTNGISQFPNSEKKETAEKLATFIKSSVASLLKQLLSETPNAEVKASLKFSQNTLFKNADGQWHMGLILEQPLVTSLKHDFDLLKTGQRINLEVLTENYKFFADEVIRHYMHDFNQTLNLGMIKRKAADMGCTAITKAVHMAIGKLIPRLTKDELQALATYHDTLFFYE
ncbi:hypothetical protein [Acinetobacter sp. HY1485]|uniref:hypothetical protein n=1 Tax=Acinetobacter sp. HY1485 TaxID=2970918 RepID=UPI0022B94408|nr:hypothetical protein [Acinetobacter sp. HY1485]